jgi:hypothetical protein
LLPLCDDSNAAICPHATPRRAIATTRVTPLDAGYCPYLGQYPTPPASCVAPRRPISPGGMKPPLAVLWLAALLLGGCALWRPAQLPAGAGLRITLSDAIDGEGTASVRGKVYNDFDQAVEGVRYVVTIYSIKTQGQVLDRWQQQVDTQIPPGGSIPMRLAVESTQFGGKGTTRFGVKAFPVALDGRAVSPPAGWVTPD